MGILLSWQLVLVLALFLIGFASSELESPHDPVSDPITTSTDTRTASKGKLPIKISFVQHESFCINIYDSKITEYKKKIYYYSPITLLKGQTVAIYNNGTTKYVQVQFTISNPAVGKKVVEHLKQFHSPEIELSQVRVLPYDSVKLTTKVPSADFLLTHEWIPYGKPLIFILICPILPEACGPLKNQLLNNIEQFDHLRLEFKTQVTDDICYNEEKSQNEEMTAEDLSTKVTKLQIKFEKDLDYIRKEQQDYFTAALKSLSDKIEITEKNLTDTQKKLENTEAELNSTRNQLINNVDLTTKLNENLERFRHELKVVEDNLRKEVGANLDSTKIKEDLGNTIDAVADLTKKLNARTSEIVDIGHMPTSCSDLQRMGQKVNGFFSIKALKKMETVYCNFRANQFDLEKSIGYVDVKSAPVHFFVHRSSVFDKINKPIVFNMERMNEGKALDLNTGKFKAPRSGVYFFSFKGLAKFSNSSSNVWLRVSLQLNGDSMGMAHVEDVNVTDQTSTVTIQSTLKLGKGDQVWVEIASKESSTLFDDGNFYTHFTGFLLEEEIFDSL